MFHPRYFRLQELSSISRQAIGVAIAGRFLFLESLNPTTAQQAPQCAIESACAQDHPAPAHLLNVLQYRIPVPRLFSQAQENQQYRFGQRIRVPGRFIMSYDAMSHNAILRSSSQ